MGGEEGGRAWELDLPPIAPMRRVCVLERLLGLSGAGVSVWPSRKLRRIGGGDDVTRPSSVLSSLAETCLCTRRDERTGEDILAGICRCNCSGIVCVYSSSVNALDNLNVLT